MRRKKEACRRRKTTIAMGEREREQKHKKELKIVQQKKIRGEKSVYKGEWAEEEIVWEEIFFLQFFSTQRHMLAAV